jgi:uncharacterized protein
MTARGRLIRWLGRFALVNVGLLAAVGLRYLWHYAMLGASLAWLYALMAFVGQMSALAYVPLAPLVILIVLIPRPRLVLPLGVIIGSAVLSLLLLDSLLFTANRYHIGVLTFSLLEPTTWAFLALYFMVALAIEAMLAGWVWMRRLLTLGFVNQSLAREASMAAAMARRPGGELQYPMTPLRCGPSRPLLNVLLVVIDGMRADALTSVAAPRLAAFARGAMRFDNHLSGGNVSRPGMFSLFYSLPATYWHVFADAAQPPVLMDLLRQHDYQFGIFASSPVYSRVVALDRTALARVPDLRLETISPYPGSSGRDLTLTEEWLEWLARRDPARPFFGFLFYNAVVANEPPPGYRAPLALPVGDTVQGRLHARYLTAMHYVDSLIGRVLDDLERRQLIERTLIVVTSDHGMEFGETGLGFDGHGSGFTRFQLQTPFLLHWPGRPGDAWSAAPRISTRHPPSWAGSSDALIRLPTTRAATISTRTRSGIGSSPPTTRTTPSSSATA